MRELDISSENIELEHRMVTWKTFRQRALTLGVSLLSNARRHSRDVGKNVPVNYETGACKAEGTDCNAFVRLHLSRDLIIAYHVIIVCSLFSRCYAVLACPNLVL